MMGPHRDGTVYVQSVAVAAPAAAYPHIQHRSWKFCSRTTLATERYISLLPFDLRQTDELPGDPLLATTITYIIKRSATLISLYRQHHHYFYPRRRLQPLLVLDEHYTGSIAFNKVRSKLSYLLHLLMDTQLYIKIVQRGVTQRLPRCCC
jgi:hypothetical protein